EPQLVLKEVGEVLQLFGEAAGIAESRRPVAAKVDDVLHAHGQRVPLASVEGAEPFGLPPVRVDLRAEIARVGVERNRRIGRGGRILEALLVPEAADSRVRLEPLDGLLVPLQAQRHRLALLTRVGIEDKEWTERRRSREVEGQIGLGAVVADGQPDVPIRGKRHAHPGARGALLRAFVAELAVAFEPGYAQRVVEDLVAPAEAGTLAQRVVVADLARGECRERPFAAFGDDVDDTTDGIGAVECRLRTPNDLDPLDLAERYV